MSKVFIALAALIGLLVFACIIEPSATLWSLNAIGLHVPYTVKTFFAAFILLTILSFRFKAEDD